MTPLPTSVLRVLFQIGDYVRTHAAHFDADTEETEERTLQVVEINTQLSSAGHFIQYTGVEPDGKRWTFANFYGAAIGSPPRLATEAERVEYQKARRESIERANAVLTTVPEVNR
jgi:hypothetical protein